MRRGNSHRSGWTEIRFQCAVPLVQRTRPVIGNGPLHTVQVDTLEITFINLHPERAFALVMGRRAHEVTGTARITVATLKVGASDAPVGHFFASALEFSTGRKHYSLKKMTVQLYHCRELSHALSSVRRTRND